MQKRVRILGLAFAAHQDATGRLVISRGQECVLADHQGVAKLPRQRVDVVDAARPGQLEDRLHDPGARLGGVDRREPQQRDPPCFDRPAGAS